MKNELELWYCCVLSSQTRIERLGFPSAWEVSHRLGKQIEMVGIVEAKKRWNNNYLWSSVGFEEEGRDACCPGMQQSRATGRDLRQKFKRDNKRTHQTYITYIFTDSNMCSVKERKSQTLDSEWVITNHVALYTSAESSQRCFKL